jgi:axial budding pattern protein 2
MSELVRLYLIASILFAVIPATLCQPAAFVNKSFSTQRISVARFNQSFSWSFSPDSFSTNGQTLAYRAYGLPGWLSFNQTTRTISGMPSADRDVGVFPVQIVATADDSPAMQAFDTVTIISTADPAPILNEPLTMQITPATPSIASAYAYTQESEYYPGVRVPPAWSFSVGLQPFTFQDPQAQMVYYRAELEDGAELPDWLIFDNDTVTFHGVTQSYEDPVVYRISILGSDYYGYSDIEQTFSIVVSDSNIQVAPEGLSLNITAGYPLRNVSWQDIGGLTVADRVVGTGDIAHVKVDTSDYDWLSFNETDGMFKGIPPAMLVRKQLDRDIVVTVTDHYNGTISGNLSLDVGPYAFTSDTLPFASVDSNGTVTVPIAKYIIGGMAPLIDASVHPVSQSSCIRYDPVSRNLSVIAPAQVDGGILTVSLLARDPITNAKSFAALAVNITRPAVPATAMSSEPRGISRNAVIALATVAGLIGMLVILIVLSCLLRRRHQDRTESFQRIKSRPVTGDKGDSWHDIHIGRVESAGAPDMQDTGSHDYESVIKASLSRHKPSSPYSADTIRQHISYPMMLRPQSPQRGPPRPAPLPSSRSGQQVAELSVIHEAHEGTTNNSPSLMSAPGSDFVNDDASLRDSLVSFYTGHTPENLHTSRAARKNTPLPFENCSSLGSTASQTDEGGRYADHPGSLDDHERIRRPAPAEMSDIYGINFRDHGADRFVVSVSGKRIVSHGTVAESADCGSSSSEYSAAAIQNHHHKPLASHSGRSISSRPSSRKPRNRMVDRSTEPLPTKSAKGTTPHVL